MLVGCLWSSAVCAQPSDQVGQAAPAELTDAERAVELGRAALADFEAGRFASAHDQFRQADELAHSPVFVLFMARCKNRLDELLAARTLYRALLEETIGADAPAQWSKAQQDGRSELAQLEAELPKLSVEAPVEGSVMLDGRPLSEGERSGVALDPGEHSVSFTSADGAPHTRQLTLARGKSERVVFEPPPAVASPPRPTAPLASAGEPAESQGSIVPGAVLLGLAGAGLVAGVITGSLALKKANDVTSRCDASGACRGAELISDRDAATRMAHGATASFAIAGAAAVAGIVLVIVRPGGGQPHSGFDPATLSVRF